jgi:uncharacterized protein
MCPKGGLAVPETPQAVIEPELLEILACPIDLAKLELQGDRLVCTRCRTKYRIEEGGIPNMLIEEAELPPGVSSYTELEGWKERTARKQ